MAAVVHESWVNADKNLLIMPGTIPLEASSIRSEFLRYIDNPWDAVISKDIDGSTSYAFSLDRDNPNLGRYSACRRVTRTIFVGSAATLNTANKGIDDKHIKLGCVQPGEAVPTFGDALRRMTMSGGSTHLYTENNRFTI